MKLTKGQIEAIRALSAELADKLEAGESVTLEPPPRVWEPKCGRFYAHCNGLPIEAPSTSRCRKHGVERKTREAAKRLSNDQRIFNRLHAYREEFAPGYEVPPVGDMAWAPALRIDGQYVPDGQTCRSPVSIYMPFSVCEELCRKLNSGEVVL